MKILITDDVHPCLIQGFKNRHYHCDYFPEITPQEVLEIIPIYNGLIVNTKIVVNSKLIDRAAQLQVVARLGSGLDTIDQELLKSHGIQFFNTPEANSTAVAEHCVGMILSLFRKIPKANQEVKKGKWIREENRGRELSGLQAGVIGLGHVGTKLANLLLAFGCKLFLYDPYKHLEDWKDKAVVCKDLEDLYNCQLISFHTQLQEDTFHYFNTDFLSRMKNSFYLVNSSRGKIVDTKVLIEGLTSGKILGACIDVLENEKISDWNEEERKIYEQLTDFQQVILSPHIAGWTVESKERIAKSVLEKWPLFG